MRTNLPIGLNPKKISFKVFFALAAVLLIGGFFVLNSVLAVSEGATILPASGGTNISIDTSSASAAAGYTVLSGPLITENNPGDIDIGTHTLILPDGWEFDAGSSVTVFDTLGDISPSSQSAVITENTLSFTIDNVSTIKSSLAFMFNKIKVRPAGRELTSGEITHSGDPIIGVENGVTGFGTLSTVAGAPTHIILEDSAAGGNEITDIELASGENIGIYANQRDQFGNFVVNTEAVWLLSESGGGVDAGDLAPAEDKKSALFIGRLVGTGVVSASAGEFSDESGMITVVPGPVNANNSTVDINISEATVNQGANTIIITITAIDAAGNVVSGANAVLNISGEDNYVAPASNTTDESGMAVFTLYSTKAEEKTITATAGGTIIAQQPIVTFIPDSASGLEIQTQPSGAATAGEPFAQQPAVTIVDQFGNLINDDNSTGISVSANGDLHEILTAAAIGGVAEFTGLYNTKAESINLNFSAAGLTPVSSDSIIVSPNAPAQITFSVEPATAEDDTVDYPFTDQPVVGVKDDYDNNVADGTSVILTKSNGTGELLGNLEVLTNNGLAAFSNIGYSKLDVFTISATAGSASVTSADLGPLKAGVIANFIITAPPEETVGSEFTVFVSDAIDQYGNPASGTVIISGAENSPNETSPIYNDITVTGGSGDAQLTLFNAAGTTLNGTVGLAYADTGVIDVDHADATRIVLTSFKSTVNANGLDNAVIIGQLKDAYGNNTNDSGTTITFSTNKGELAPESAITDNGAAAAVLSAGEDKTAGTALVTAASEGLTNGNISIDFIDVTAPDAPVITSPAGSVIINIANQASQTLSGAAEAGSTVEIYINTEATGITAIAAENGNFTFTNDDLIIAGIITEADYSLAKEVSVNATDAAGNISDYSNPISYTQDTIAPLVSSYTLNGSEQNMSFNPALDSVSIIATASEPVNWVSARIYKSDDDAIYKQKSPGGDGTNETTFVWVGDLSSTDNPPAPDGQYTIKVNIKDLAGNNASSLILNPYTVTVDTISPTVSLSYSSNPAKAGAMIITASYSEPIINVPQISLDRPGTADSGFAEMSATENSAVWTYGYVVNQADGGAYLDGTATISLSAVSDAAGNQADDPAFNTFIIDTTAPVTTLSVAEPNGANGWYVDAPAITLSASDNFSGAAAIHYRWDEESEQTYSEPLTASEGIHTLNYWTEDNAGNIEELNEREFRINLTNPTVNAGGDLLANAPLQISGASAADAISGIYSYAWSGPEEISFSDSSIINPAVSAAADGVYEIILTVTDNAGRTESDSFELTWDTTAPIALLINAPDGITGQTSTDITVGGEEVTGYKYKLDDGEYSDEYPASEHIILDDLTDGPHALSVIARDQAGNYQAENEATAASWTVDQTAPSTSAFMDPAEPNGLSGWYIAAPEIILTCSDQEDLSGCAGTFYRWDDGEYAEGAAITAPEGVHTLSYYSTDSAGNQEAEQSIASVKVDTAAPVISLNSLFTGQTLNGGSKYTINWTASDDNLKAMPITLAYSADGVNYSGIATVADSGSYNWVVPKYINSSNAIIMVTAADLAGNEEYAQSDVFTIAYSETVDNAPPAVILNSPNGGELWQGGSTQVITWTAADNVSASGDIAIMLEYSTDGSASWQTIIDSADNDGAYLWTVPDSASGQVLIKVTAEDEAGNSGSDLSNAVFNITARPVYICADAGGGQWSCDISLNAGWNLISLPVIASISIADSAINDQINTIQYYDNAAGWQFYLPAGGESNILTSIEDGKGYWINMNAPATLNVIGAKAVAAPELPKTYNVYPGWNLIGFKSTITQPTATYLGTLPASSYTLLDGGSENKTSGNMDAGQGYWLWMTSGGSIITYSESE